MVVTLKRIIAVAMVTILAPRLTKMLSQICHHVGSGRLRPMPMALGASVSPLALAQTNINSTSTEPVF